MAIANIVKENPIKASGAILSSIVAVLGAFWTFDSHYATAADMQNMDNKFTQQINQNRAEDLDDKIFILELKKNQQKGKLDALDGAMLERYKRKLDTINTQQKSQEVAK